MAASKCINHDYRDAVGRCRQCHKLAYHSQYEDKLDRAFARAKAARWVLGSKIDLLSPGAPKPRGMHARTFKRHRENAGQESRNALEQARKELERLRFRSANDSEKSYIVAMSLLASVRRWQF